MNRQRKASVTDSADLNKSSILTWIVVSRSFSQRNDLLLLSPCCKFVSKFVCDKRELWPDRSMYEHPVWSQTCSSIHPDTRRKKTHREIQPSSPYFGGEIESEYGKCGKKHANVSNISAAMADIDVWSGPLCSPDIDTQ
jgi:hypothetical protein